MLTRYERDTPVFLSLYRFVSYGLAVILTQVLPLNSLEGPSPGTYMLLGLAGLYTVLKVGGPIRAWRSGSSGLVLLWIDFILCLAILLGTGGLDSAYLLYSLTPLITASLLFTERLSLAVTTISAVSVTFAHLTAIWWDTPYTPLTLENRLFWLILFVTSAFLTATMVHRSNLNLRQRIEVTAVDEERRRIRRELHDGLAQSLGYMRMRTEMVAKLIGDGRVQEAQSTLKEVLATTEDTYQEVRDTLDQLSAETGPITTVLAGYVAAFGEQSGIESHFQATPPDVRLPAPVDFQLIRIVQEALRNVRRHSKATQAQVQLTANRKSVQLIIQDNGRGFDYNEKATGDSGHHGLVVMRERAEGMGGSLNVTSLPGQGTLIRAIIPHPDRRR